MSFTEAEIDMARKMAEAWLDTDTSILRIIATIGPKTPRHYRDAAHRHGRVFSRFESPSADPITDHDRQSAAAYNAVNYDWGREELPPTPKSKRRPHR